MEEWLFAVSFVTLGWSWWRGLVGWHSIFEATFWLMAIQFFYFGVRIFLPMMNWSRLRRIYTSSALAVAFLFWSLFITDRALIQSNYMQVPLPLNHLQHTVPVIMALLAPKHREEPRPSKAPVATILAVVYIVLVASRYAVTGVWTYPFMAKLGGSLYWILAVLSCGGMYIFERVSIRFFE